MLYIYSHIPNVNIITDDISIGSKTESHDRASQQIITTCRESGVHLNGDKCHLPEDKITFFGHVLSKDVGSVDPKD